jgi:hypothetical protein
MLRATETSTGRLGRSTASARPPRPGGHTDSSAPKRVRPVTADHAHRRRADVAHAHRAIGHLLTDVVSPRTKRDGTGTKLPSVGPERRGSEEYERELEALRKWHISNPHGDLRVISGESECPPRTSAIKTSVPHDFRSRRARRAVGPMELTGGGAELSRSHEWLVSTAGGFRPQFCISRWFFLDRRPK